MEEGWVYDEAYFDQVSNSCPAMMAVIMSTN